MKKYYPKITVYVVNRNNDRYLTECLSSIIIQTYKNLEIIIIDDFSTDKSIELIKKFKQKNKKVITIFNKRKIGLVKSIIKAIKKATGKYVIRLDSDDYLKSNAINKMYLMSAKSPRIALIFPNFIWINEKSEIINRFNYKISKNIIGFSDQPAHGACSLIKRNILLKIGGYNSNFDRQDGYYIWYLILSKNYRIKHIKENLFYYRKHKNNLSNNRKKILSTRLKILNYFIKSKKINNRYIFQNRLLTINELKKIKPQI